MEVALRVDQAAPAEVLARQLGELAQHDQVVVLRLFAVVGDQPDRWHGQAAGGDAGLGVGESADRRG